MGLAAALRACYAEVFIKLHDDESLLIADGNLKFDELVERGYDIVSLIKADTQIPTVMAGSIIAKQYRDTLMKLLHNKHPLYDWVNNVGYGAAKHKAALKLHGFTPLHRMSYKIKL
jgi:ribonuclease HII